jgi:hypothetical protein
MLHLPAVELRKSIRDSIHHNFIIVWGFLVNMPYKMWDVCAGYPIGKGLAPPLKNPSFR